MADKWGQGARLNYKEQSVDERYGLPENFLEVEVTNPITTGEGRKRFTTYEIRVTVRTLSSSLSSSLSSPSLSSWRLSSGFYSIYVIPFLFSSWSFVLSLLILIFNF